MNWVAQQARKLAASIFTGHAIKRADVCVIASIIGLIFFGVLVFGLDSAEVSLAYGAFLGVGLLVCLSRFPPSHNLFKIQALTWVAGLFAALVIYAVCSLTSMMPVQTGPFWGWVADAAGTLDRSSTILEVTRLINLGAAFGIGMILGGSDGRARLSFLFILSFSCFYALLTLASFVAFPSAVLGVQKTIFAGRFMGSFLSPNVAAGFLGLIAMLLLSKIDLRLIFLPGKGTGEWVLLAKCAGFLAIVVDLLLSASRAGVFAFFLALIFMYFLDFKSKDKQIFGLNSKWMGYIFAAGISLILLFSGNVLTSRFLNSDYEWSGRRVVFSEHWNNLKHSPIFGFGLGSFSTLNQTLITPENFQSLYYLRAAHNVYLQWLEECGILGAGLMFVLIGVLLYEIYIGLQRRSQNRSLMIGVLTGSFFLLVEGFFDFSLQTPAIAIFWSFLLGLAFAVSNGGRKGQDRHRAEQDPVTSQLSTWTPRTLGFASLFASLLVMWGLGWPSAKEGYPLAGRSAYAIAAQNALAKPAAGEDTRLIDQLISSGLKQGPADPVLWILRAQTHAGRPEGVVAFERSYVCSPINPELMPWRAFYAASHWNGLSSELKQTVMTEIYALHEGWGAEPWLRSLAGRYRGTAFGTALTLTLTLMTPKEPVPKAVTP